MPAKIYYYDIGDYLSREEKLKIVSEYQSFDALPLTQLQPNEHGDWISQRNDAFSQFIPLEPEKKLDAKTQSFFVANVIGVSTCRDAWVYSFSQQKVTENMQRMIDFYNKQANGYKKAIEKNPNLSIEDYMDTDETKISWTRALRNDAKKYINHSFDKTKFYKGVHRPFTKQQLYYHKQFIESPGLWTQFFSTPNIENLVICLEGTGSSKNFGCLITDTIPDYSFAGIHTQCFPLYYYEENQSRQRTIFDTKTGDDYIRRDAVSDFILDRARKQYGKNVTKEDIFYYVYGFLHSPEYRETFSADLKKMLPRLPLVDEPKVFWQFSKAGRQLAQLHLNYETVGAYKGVMVLYEPLSITDALRQVSKTEMEYLNYRVEKMRFPKKDQKDTIIYNGQIMVKNIPAKAYQYIVNGKSAIEWIMERYAVTVHKDSGIKNDPNDWAKEHDDPKYILNLLMSVINVSAQTVEIVETLPKVVF
ncbi:MAG: hypothetical protein LBQ66_14980 [Planctomycetaceae bacterium]|jgi:predicted helicase|nr:hypothetical protein [Planctomycetaceae bacterium]